MVLNKPTPHVVVVVVVLDLWEGFGGMGHLVLCLGFLVLMDVSCENDARFLCLVRFCLFVWSFVITELRIFLGDL